MMIVVVILALLLVGFWLRRQLSIDSPLAAGYLTAPADAGPMRIRERVLP